MKKYRKMMWMLLPLMGMMAAPSSAQRLATPNPDDYELIYADEFEGDVLNSQAWNIEINGNGGGNNELQYYSANNVRVADGCLVITARRENSNGREFTSGRVNTMGKVAFKHGLLEASIKLPHTANGLWPAFWMMGNDMSTGTTWPYCGEVDVLEAGSSAGISAGTQDRLIISALHWGPYTNGEHPMYGKQYTAPYSLQDDEFHLYTVEWDEEKIAMYLDRDRYPNADPYYVMNIDDHSQQNSPGNYFHKQFFVLLNVAVGGTIPNIYNSAGITALNNGEQNMMVDYVRIYQKADAKDYITPDGSEGGDDEPEILPDEETNLGRYGSLSLDENGQSTFDFENSYDYVLIGTSQGVKDQMGDKVIADYNVDDVNNFLYVWENTYSARESEGVNSFGLEEPWSSFTVLAPQGWSGLGYASKNQGKDLSMIDDSYILHFAMRGTDQLMHTSHAMLVGNAHFTIGNANFVDNGASYPVLGDFKRDGRWCSFDIPVSILLNLADPIYNEPVDNILDNVFAVLSGGVGGAQLQFDNVFFYKNDNYNVELPTVDEETNLGRYGSLSLDENSMTTFDFDDAYDYVLIGTSQGVKDQMGAENIVADYNVDDVNNFLWVWDGTYQALPSEGVNSFGLDEKYNSYEVTHVGWSGLGYASAAGHGKDLSMLDDSYYLHVSMRGTDMISHMSHTMGVGAAQFTIGRSSNGPMLIGDFKRDGRWCSFDIPFSLIRSVSGSPFETTADSYTGNVISFLSGGVAGTQLQFDNIFFYRKHSDTDKPEVDPVLGKYGSRSLDDEGNPTFDLDNHGDYVLLYLGENEAQRIADATLADYRVNDVSNFLWIWDGTYTPAVSQGVNAFGEEEGYGSYTVAAPQGWSGLGLASTGGNGTGKDLSMIDDSYTLHLSMMSNDSIHHITHSVWVGNAKVALGETPFVDGNTTYGLVGDFYRDGQWYSFDIPVEDLKAFADPLYTGANNLLDNAIAFLSGGTQGADLNFDAIFFYRDKQDIPEPVYDKGDVNGDGSVDGNDLNTLINIILGKDDAEVYDGRANVDEEGDIDGNDLNALINILLGK